jgi:hypothetical protein
VTKGERREQRRRKRRQGMQVDGRGVLTLVEVIRKKAGK